MARIRKLLGWLLLLCVLGAFLPSLTARVHTGFAPGMFQHDACVNVAPFLRYHEQGAMRDYITDYLLATFPVGYRALYGVVASVVDPRVASHVIGLMLHAGLLACLGIVAARAGGRVAAAATIALGLSSEFILDRLSSGQQRSFGLPIIALMTVALALGRPRLGIIATWLGFAFYPVAGVCNALTLAVWILVFQSRDAQDAPVPLRSRVKTIAIAGIVSLAIVTPMLLAMRPYGKMITAETVADFPEANAGGRLEANDRMQSKVPLGSALGRVIALTYSNEGEPWSPSLRVQPGDNSIVPLIAVLGYFTALLGWMNPLVRRILIQAGSIAVAYTIARHFAPHLYIPERYASIGWPALLLLIPALSAASLEACLKRVVPKYGFEWSIASRGALLVVTFFVVLVHGGRINPMGGLQPHDGIPLDVIQRLPPQSQLAGWPTAMDAIPYVTARSVFLSEAAHLPYHENYTRAMRDRMIAITAAWTMADVAAVRDLRDRSGVTHLIVDRRHLALPPPGYFAPFKPWIRLARGDRPPSETAIAKILERCAIWSNDPLYVLDLSLLDAKP